MGLFDISSMHPQVSSVEPPWGLHNECQQHTVWFGFLLFSLLTTSMASILKVVPFGEQVALTQKRFRSAQFVLSLSRTLPTLGSSLPTVRHATLKQHPDFCSRPLCWRSPFSLTRHGISGNNPVILVDAHTQDNHTQLYSLPHPNFVLLHKSPRDASTTMSIKLEIHPSSTSLDCLGSPDPS